MKVLRSLLRRREFLVVFVISGLGLVFGRVVKILDLFFKMGIADASEKPGTFKGRPLRGAVVYYSATGSTGKIAGAIYRGMKTVMECDVAPLKKIDPKEMGKYDVIAIGGPIWYFRETANLRLFIHNMPHMAGKPCITFCTHGRAPSGFFYSLAQPLKKKGLAIIGWSDWYGDCSHVLHMPKPYYTGGHPDNIDLAEAEAFGREMAGRAQRIYSGEKDLIPEIPYGPATDGLWIAYGLGRGEERGNAFGAAAPQRVEEGNTNVYEGEEPGSSATEAAASTERPSQVSERQTPLRAMEMTNNDMEVALAALKAQGGRALRQPITACPTIDSKKCIYPRCSACEGCCPLGAITLSLTAPSDGISGSPLYVNEGSCAKCSFPLCQGACLYDAVIYKSHKSVQAVDSTKCTYPRCTLCSDHCPMNAIDLTQNPVLFHNNCEGCNLCWCICPEDAIYIRNLLEHQHANSLLPRDTGETNIGTLRDHEATGRFRWLVSLDEVGKDCSAVLLKKAPRVVLNEEDYPYNVK